MAEENKEDFFGEAPSDEEIEEGSPETPLEEDKQQPSPEPDKEILDLFKSVKEEVGEKRFDGLMSAWQKDRSRLTQLEKDLTSFREKGEEKEKTQDDKWLEYLDQKLEERRMSRQTAEDLAVERAISAVLEDYPDLTAKEIAETVVKYSGTEDKTISPWTAAQILMDAKSYAGAAKGLSQEELRKKRATAVISGKAGVETTPGVKPYSSEKDKDKDYRQLMEEGLKELGQ